ncbi:hypothetical protein EROM_082020 [Encephalitozoon romaleae SJ-2008]|uniref:Uncharacterized protein n=1 Tax=Encephalitozoon romaleae (strain SJ-2008) TaxID=1178016 RepID=I6ZV42_ENCRO|nr:hypothetical protein EROM_082020 [Encephalitozoon romaleae SJ-2008]AFN83616.1 hypothetical protein EROM_082020 [Encephalitozoon romaleae SJ-2008]
MNILGLYKIRESSEKKNKPSQSQYKGFLAFISMALPMLIYYIFKEHEFDGNPLLKFLTVLPPLSYSAVEYFTLFRDNWYSDWKSLTILQRMFYFIFNILFAMFSIVSIFSAIIFPFAEWDDNDGVLANSVFLPSLFVPLPYLLCTSCSLTPELISFIDTGTTICIDLVILSLSIVSLILLSKGPEHYIYIPTSSLIFILVRSLKEYIFPSSKYLEYIITWRTLIFIVIFLTNVFIYVSVGLSISTPSRIEAFLGSKS